MGGRVEVVERGVERVGCGCMRFVRFEDERWEGRDLMRWVRFGFWSFGFKF